MVASIALLPGCSIIFVNGPPEGHEQLRYFDCSSSAAAPVADGTWAGLDALMLAVLADPDPGEEPPATGLAFFGTLAALHVASTIYGIVNASECSDAKQHLQQRIADQHAADARLIDELRRQVASQPPESPPARPAQAEQADPVPALTP